MLETIKKKCKEHVQQLFATTNTEKLCYHNYEHTVDVVLRIQTLSPHLNSKQQNLLTIAGWFHDVGYLYGYDQHEHRGMKIAATYLRTDLSAEDITTITQCIEATQLKMPPRNELEEIIKDADIGYGVTEHFFTTGPQLRKEWQFMLNKTYSDKDWELLQYEFLKQVVFYSPKAKATYQPILKQNLNLQLRKIDALA